MSKYSSSKEEKVEILKFYQESKFSLNEVAELYKVHRDIINDWQNNYLLFGESCN